MLPSRIAVVVFPEGGIWGATTPEIVPGAVSATHLLFTPRPTGETVPDPSVRVELSGDRFELSIPPAAMTFEGTAVTEPFDLVLLEPTPEQRALIPGDQLSLRNDTDVVPIRIFEVVNVQALRRDDILSVADDLRVTMTFDLPADSPLFADPDNAKVWRYSASSGFWVGGTKLYLDEATHTGTAEVSGLGWIAVSLEAPDRPCLTGRAVAGGSPAAGVEIRAFQEGLMGVDRVTSLADGTFCLPTDDGATTSFRALGFDNTRTAMYTGGGTATGPIGDVPLDTLADEDQDRTFSGAGGDCDDTDAAVGPNSGLADGTWCGEPL
jgi:hypothetical protein